MSHNISVKTIIGVSFKEERTDKLNKQNTLAIQFQAVKQWQYRKCKVEPDWAGNCVKKT